MSTRLPIEERYWSKVQRLGPDECWRWTGALFEKGHAQFWDGTYLPSGSPRMVIASRWAYKHFIEPIPPGMYVLHHCDIADCQNPNCWFLGTIGDNNRDRHRKGRTVLPDNRGVNHGMAKLTMEQVQEIRERYAAGGVKQSDLAAEFGVLQQQISRIVRRTSW